MDESSSGNNRGNEIDSVFLTEIKPIISDIQSQPYQHDPEKGFTIDIMMMLDMQKVGSLREEFQRTEKGLSIAEFVHVMTRFVESITQVEENSRLKNLSDKQLVANLCELFAQIDINGDGSMEWEEFTSFIVETGLTVQNHQPHSIRQYHFAQWEDTSKHRTFIDRLYYFPNNDIVGLIENCCPTLKLYNSNCDLIHSIKTPNGFLQAAEHIPQLNQYVLASSDHQFRFYDDTNLKFIKSCHTTSAQTCLIWHPEQLVASGGTLFSSGTNGVISAWDIDKMDEKYQMGGEVHGRMLLRSHEDIVMDLLTLPTLGSLASASMDRTIRLWDIQTGKHKQCLEGHAKGVRALAYSPDYRFLVSAGFDIDALVWNPYVDQLILRLHGHSNSLCSVEIIQDTPQIITADVDGIFKVWDIRNFACMQTFTAEGFGGVNRMVAVTTQKRIVAAGKKLIKFDYAKLDNPDLADDHPVFAALYNPTSLTFVTAAGKNVKIWDAQHGKLLRVYRDLSETDLTSLCLDFRERKIIVGDHDGRMHVYDYLNGSHMKSFAYMETNNRAHNSEISRICYCAHYMAVISVSWDGCVNIHDESDSERGVLLRRMSGGHTKDISALAFSQFLSLIATGSSDNSLQLWDYEFGRLESSYIGHVAGILALMFLDPFPLILSTDNSGNIAIWATRPSQHKAKCVYQFKNHIRDGLRGGNVPVNCVTKYVSHSNFQSEWQSNPLITSYLIFTGDDKGALAIWDILPLINKLDKEYGFGQHAKPYECINPNRNLRIDATSTVRKVQRGPEWTAFQHRDPACTFYFTPGTPLVKEVDSHDPMQIPLLINCLQRWQAHNDVIYSIQVIDELHSIVTSSFDRQVKIWSFAGECLGELQQGESLSKRREWKFKVDYAARERKKEKNAEPIIQDIHQFKNEQQKDNISEFHKPPSMKECPESLSNDLCNDLTKPFLPILPSSVTGRRRIDMLIPQVPPARKTPQRKPVTVSNAGRLQIMSPRQLRAMNQMTHSLDISKNNHVNNKSNI